MLTRTSLSSASASPHAHPVVLLGPLRTPYGQGVARPHYDEVLKHLGLLGLRAGEGPIAVVTAGWQERESEDQQLMEALAPYGAVNLNLHARAEAVFLEDLELSAAYKARQERLRHMQSFYRTRLEAADEAAHSIAVRHVDEELLEEERVISIEILRQFDADHTERCRKVYDDFEATWRPTERESVRTHRDAIAKALQGAQALFIAGGHVSSLLNRLRLFDVIGAAAHVPILASSAGAMTLSDRIVCFHDHPPYGRDVAQVLDRGFGLVPDVVVMPDPRSRVRLLDVRGIARFARRMAPAKCLALDVGHALISAPHAELKGQAWELECSGQVNTKWGERR